MAYELVVGHVPFHDTEAPMAILMRHVNEPIRSPIEVRPDIDPALSQWIDALLVKDPSTARATPSMRGIRSRRSWSGSSDRYGAATRGSSRTSWRSSRPSP